MARPPDPTIKARLLEQCLDSLVEKGVHDFSLRKIAEQVGTSARMLVYHFGSAEALFAEMIMAYSRREKVRLQALADAQRNFDSVGAFIEFYWTSYLTEQRMNVLTAFVEIYGRCLRGRKKYAAFFQEILFEWIALSRQILEQRCGLHGRDSTVWATLIVAACRGLLLDRLASGETDRSGEAAALFQNITAAYRPDKRAVIGEDV